MALNNLIDGTTFAELQATAGAEFVVELVDTFAEEAPQMLGELREAYAAGAAERFRRAAHSLKSNSATFGASRLAEMARTLELGGMPADSGAVQALEAELAATVAELRERAQAGAGDA